MKYLYHLYIGFDKIIETYSGDYDINDDEIHDALNNDPNYGFMLVAFVSRDSGTGIFAVISEGLLSKNTVAKLKLRVDSLSKPSKFDRKLSI